MSIYGIGTTFWFLLGAKYVLPVLLFSQNPALGSAVGSMISASFFSLVLFLYLDRKRIKASWPVGLKLAIAYLAWTLLTISYTAAFSKGVAVAYWAVMAFDAGSATLLMRMGKTDRMAAACLKGIIGGSLLISTVTLLLLRTGGTDGRWGDEELLHPNMIGNQLVLASLCAIHLLFGHRNAERRLKILCALSVLVVTLLGTFSKTSILGFAIAAVIFLWRVRIKATRKLALFMLAPIGAALAILRLGNQIEHYLSTQMSGQALDTLTGRTIIWAESIQMILERPIFGYGYVAYRDVGPQFGQVRTVHAHNDFLNVWFNSGMIGLVIVLGIYVATVIAVRRKRTDRFDPDQDPIPLTTALMAFSFVRSLTEGNISNIVFSLHLVCLLHVWLGRLRTQSVTRSRRVSEWTPVPAPAPEVEPADSVT